MADGGPDLEALLSKALRHLADYVEDRPADATFDDDVRALESVTEVLQRVGPDDRPRLVALLGPTHADRFGLVG